MRQLISLVILVGIIFAPSTAQCQDKWLSDLYKSIKSDYTLKINTDKQHIQESYTLQIKAFDKKILHISINGKKDSKFKIPFDRFDMIRLIRSGSTSSILQGKPSVRQDIYIELYAKKEGSVKIPIKTDFLNVYFILNITVLKGEMSLADVIKKIGFESYVTNGTSKDRLIKRFGKPNSKSVVFRDNFQFYNYYFSEYRMGYQVLLKNNTVFDYKKYSKQKDGGSSAWF